MTGTARTYRTGFERVFDCPAGRAAHVETITDATGPALRSTANRK